MAKSGFSTKTTSMELNGEDGLSCVDLVKKFEKLLIKVKSLNGFNESKNTVGNNLSTFITPKPDVLDSYSLEMLTIEDPVSIMTNLRNKSEEFFQLLDNTDFSSHLVIVVVKILAKVCSHDAKPLRQEFVTVLRKVLTTELFEKHTPQYLMTEPLKCDVLWQFHLSNTLKNLAILYKLLVPSASRDILRSILKQLVICKDSSKKLNSNYFEQGIVMAEEFERLITKSGNCLNKATEEDRNVAFGFPSKEQNGVFGHVSENQNGVFGHVSENQNVCLPEVPERQNVSTLEVHENQTVSATYILDVTSELCPEEYPYENIPQEHTVVRSKELVSFRHTPVYPAHNDMLTKPVLTPNIIKGPYGSINHYLNIQFNLMREDLLGPLRDVIESLSAKKLTGGKNICVYRDVTVGRPVVTVEGMTFELQCKSLSFPGTGATNGSHRLLPGSLLCVSADNFKTFSVAIVAPDFSSELGRRTRSIKVEFLEPKSFIRNFTPSQGYLVIKSPSYYEAYKHVLLGLQTLTEIEFPLERFIIDVETNVGPPKYLKPGTFYTLPFDSSDSEAHPSLVEVLNATSWPPAEYLGLDKAQLLALQAALTRELAIIQGPPGTGKTFIGLKIVKTLLHNEKVWNEYSERSPILVVCYTNHALDQFLEGVLKFCPAGVVRIGGGSKSGIVSEHNLRHKRQNMRKWQVRDLYDNRNVIKYNLKENEFILRQSMECVQPKTTLRQYMLQNHYGQFSTYGNDDNYDQFPYLEIWLDVVDFQEKNVWNAGWKSRDGVTKCYNLRKSEVVRELQSEDVMWHSEMINVDDVWTLAIVDRWRLYRLWNSLLRKDSVSIMISLELKYRKVLSQITDIRQILNVSALRAAKVIGMTTTGAAKNLKVMQEVGAKIVLIEEAAKVFECHALMSVTKDCEHVIMIGDHQQLRPTPNVYDLGKRCHLDVSMFERFIKNGLPFITLTLQHRMRPEIASLLVPHIYKELRNHLSVSTYEDIRGVCSGNVYFVDHTEAESRVEQSTTWSNEHEADFISCLCRYIVNQGYEPKRITVLTTYLGQLATIESAMVMKGLSNVHCASVDNYQGEENDIVLLSLVRSNEVDNVGFMNITNRVCVALSRAKMGFYCIGNFSLLVSGSEIWKPIVRDLQMNNFIGRTMKLRCSNHLDTITEVTTSEDFLKVPEGGCSLPCDKVLECGHMCQLHCHGYDKEHEKVNCGHQCEKFCLKDHRCSKLCYEECGDCKVEVFEFYSDCKHENIVFCYQYETNVPCKADCPKIMSCGHQCTNRCGESCSLEDCRHYCTKTLECGHPCQGLCGKPCSAATECKALTEKHLSCGHSITGYCGTEYRSSDCQEPVTVAATPCGHEVTVKCSSANDVKHVLDNCTVPCLQELSCGHICAGTCGQCVQGRAHIECRVQCDLSLLCGHQYKGACFKDFAMCNMKCLMRCGHESCPYPCSWPCKPCYRDCAWRCSHYKCSRKCNEICNRPPCDKPCMKLLSCGHKCLGLCGEMCPNLCRICDEREVKSLFFGTEDAEGAKFVQLVDCGHVFEVTALDRWMELRGTTNLDGGSNPFRAKTCPKCNVLIMQTTRYNNNIKTFLHRFIFIKKIIFEHVDLFDKSLTDLMKLWQKVLQRELMSVTDSSLVKEKRERLDEWISSWDRYGGPTPKQGFQFYREFLRISYYVPFENCCKYERIPLEARKHLDNIRDRLNATYQFTVLVEEEVKEEIKKLEKFVCGMKFEISSKFQLSKVFTRRPNWFKCECGNIFDQTAMENVELINGCPLCRSSLVL